MIISDFQVLRVGLIGAQTTDVFRPLCAQLGVPGVFSVPLDFDNKDFWITRLPNVIISTWDDLMTLLSSFHQGAQEPPLDLSKLCFFIWGDRKEDPHTVRDVDLTVHDLGSDPTIGDLYLAFLRIIERVRSYHGDGEVPSEK